MYLQIILEIMSTIIEKSILLIGNNVYIVCINNYIYEK